MKNSKEAAANIKRFALSMKGLIAFADDLEQIESLDNYINELKIEKDKLLKEVVDIKESKANVELDFNNKFSELKAVHEDNLVKAENSVQDKIKLGDNYIAVALKEAASIKEESDKKIELSKEELQNLKI